MFLLRTSANLSYEAAAEALMLGIVQLPAYLEKIESGAVDLDLGPVDVSGLVEEVGRG